MTHFVKKSTSSGKYISYGMNMSPLCTLAVFLSLARGLIVTAKRGNLKPQREGTYLFPAIPWYKPMFTGNGNTHLPCSGVHAEAAGNSKR